VRIWDVEEGKEAMAPLTGHTSWVSSVAFSPDGNYVVSGSSGEYDSAVKIWDVNTESRISYTKHEKSVNSVAFSPKGNYVVSGSDDMHLIIKRFTPHPPPKPL
jgi:WD40 repeat protein